MDHIALLRYLNEWLSTGRFLTVALDIPPKLPETTNFVLTNNKKDHNEIKAMKTRTAVENKIPPL